MADGSGMHGYRWPAGIVNWIAFIVALAALMLAGEGLVSALFFGHRAHLPEAWTYGIALRVLALVFATLLPLVQTLRQRYPRLLAAGVLSTLTSLFLNVAILLPSPRATPVTATYYLAFSAAAATTIVALLKGERLDEFLIGLPLVLFRALFGTRVGTGLEN